MGSVLRLSISVAQGDSIVCVVRHSTCNLMAVSSNPGCAMLSVDNLRQVVHTHSPSSCSGLAVVYLAVV